jgi:hypothetical protein
MKRICEILAILPMMFLLLSCEGTDPTPSPGPGQDPGKEDTLTPPDEVKSADVFVIDMFSTLEDDGEFFQTRDVASAAQHIAGQSGKRPLIYMFDRADFTVGQSHPLNKLSYTANIYQLFAQHEPTSATVTRGTAIATQYPINNYDGLAQNGAYMSGLTISAPLTTATPVCIYTARVSSLDQMKQISNAKSMKLLNNGVIVALVENSVKSDVVKYIEQTMSLRVATFGSNDTKLDILVVVPPAYVCRSIEKGTTINLPYYKVSIEKWLWE